MPRAAKLTADGRFAIFPRNPRSPPANDAEIAAYRSRVSASNLVSFRVAVKESDLLIACDRDLYEEARVALLRCRRDLETYIEAHPLFLQSLSPVPVGRGAPRIVRRMAMAAHRAGVGPMAAVAGAVADEVGAALALISREVLIENGGDIFCRVQQPRIVALDAGASPLSYKFGIRITPEMGELGICTSSGGSHFSCRTHHRAGRYPRDHQGGLRRRLATTPRLRASGLHQAAQANRRSYRSLVTWRGSLRRFRPPAPWLKPSRHPPSARRP